MNPTEPKQPPAEATGYVAGFWLAALRASFRGKHMSAAIIVWAGIVLLLVGSFPPHTDTRDFVQVVGCIVGAVGLVGWVFSSNES